LPPVFRYSKKPADVRNRLRQLASESPSDTAQRHDIAEKKWLWRAK
jgi:hypothetical protein